MASARCGSDRSSGGRCRRRGLRHRVRCRRAETRAITKRIQTDDTRARLDAHPPEIGARPAAIVARSLSRDPAAASPAAAPGHTRFRLHKHPGNSPGFARAQTGPVASGRSCVGSRNGRRQRAGRGRVARQRPRNGCYGGSGWPALLHQPLCARRRKGRSVMGLGEPRHSPAATHGCDRGGVAVARPGRRFRLHKHPGNSPGFARAQTGPVASPRVSDHERAPPTGRPRPGRAAATARTTTEGRAGPRSFISLNARAGGRGAPSWASASRGHVSPAAHGDRGGVARRRQRPRNATKGRLAHGCGLAVNTGGACGIAAPS